MLGLSYLSPSFFLPWPNALQDFFAIMALIILTTSTIFKKNIEIGERTLYIFLFILLIPILQYVSRILVFRQELFLSILYIGVFFLSIVNGTNLQKSLISIIDLSIFFTIIGLICVLLQLVQWSGVYHSSFILESNPLRPSANLGQPNNLATLLFISLFSNLYLFRKNKIESWLYITINITLVLGIVLTQSRTSWIVFVALLLLSYLKKDLSLFSTVVKNSALFFLLVLFIPYITLFVHGKGLNFVERIYSDSSRLDIWQQIIIAIFDRPWLGYGWNQTSVAQTEASLKYPMDIWLEYSHNMFLDIIVWNGIPLGLIIIGIIVTWFFRSYKRVTSTDELIYYFIIVTFFIHCMLEFPFAYAYFLLPVGLYVGFLNNKIDDSGIISINKPSIFLVAIFSVIFSAIVKDYISLSNKRDDYSRKYLFSQEIKTSSSELIILDALDLNNDILFLDTCDILRNKKSYQLRDVFYRYPTNKNLTTYYKSTIYNKLDSKVSTKYMLLKYPGFKYNLSSDNKCS